MLLIDPDKIDDVWGYIENYLKQAVEHTGGRFFIEDIKANIPHRRQQLWIAYEEDEDKIYGAVISEVQDYPRLRVLSIAYAGGIEFHKWLPNLLESCQEFGKLHKCKSFEIYGRNGWGKMLEHIGAKKECSLFTWEIGSGENNVVEKENNELMQ